MHNKINLRISVFFIFLIFVIFLSFYFSAALDSAYGSEIKKEDYIISRSEVKRVVSEGDVFRDYIEISNLKEQEVKISFSIDEVLLNIIEFESAGLVIPAKNSSKISFLVKGKEEGNYSGYIKLKGDIEEELLVNISVVKALLNVPVLIEVELLKKEFTLNKPLEFKLNINALKSEEIKNASFSHSILDEKNNTYFLGSETKDIMGSFQIVKKFKFPEGAKEGFYVLETTLEYNSKAIVNRAPFLLKKPFLKILVFGFIPMWLLLLVLVLVGGGFIIFYLIKRRAEKRKKYKMKLDQKTIPKKNQDFLFLGKIAETNLLAYLEPDRLMTHTIVAGATGGGKSISAQVLIEEALLKNIAVIVFDPTAQWSGMLRKCEDKKMLSYYSKFGLKESDARAFKGNVRQVKNARELIDINKYMSPGQIQIFTLNKLDPGDIDTFVANVTRQIFKSNPQESPNLKLLLIFDEVHRLLSRFGGSGEGFLQIERACREFRKWGIGVILVSQVLSDFVGEIKANISSEIQMRTRDESDLNRIKTKYGEDFLQSLVKASVGVGMFVNPAYNHARPYFITFRPILHNTRRLSDEELEKYNKYNEVVDELEYQIEQLEKEKIDTFDLRMELKLVKDKIMSGNFSVVEIYLESLTPRVEKEWQKLGKKPRKREIQLVEEKEIKKSVEEAKKSRAEWEKLEKEKKEIEEKQKAKQEEKKESIEEKQVKPLTFNNGIMVSSLKELKSVLPDLDNEIFKEHVNEKKNEIAEWLKEVSLELASKIKNITNKEELIKELKLNKEKKEEKEEKIELEKEEKKEKSEEEKQGKEKVQGKEKKEQKNKTKEEKEVKEKSGEVREIKEEKKEQKEKEQEKLEEEEKKEKVKKEKTKEKIKKKGKDKK